MESFEKDIFNNTWKLLKKYENKPGTDELWTQILTEAETFCGQYEGTYAYPLAADMMIATLKHLEVLQTRTHTNAKCA